MPWFVQKCNAFGLTQAFPCHYKHQAATIGELETVHHEDILIEQMMIGWGSHFKGHDIQDWAKEHDVDWRLYLPYN